MGGVIDAFSLLAALGAATCVYRIATPIGAISLFRLATILGILISLIVIATAPGRLRRENRRFLPFLFGAAFGPAVDLVREGSSAHLLEVYAFFANLLCCWVCVVLISTRERLMKAMKWVALAAFAAIAITWYDLLAGALPLETLLRECGSDYAQELAFQGQDGEIRRLAGPFFDPNFLGAYLVLVVAICSALWESERRWLWRVTSFASIVTLLFTLSRTALLGLLVLGLARGSRRWWTVRRVAAFGAGATAALLLAAHLWEGFLERMLIQDLSRLDFWFRGLAAFAENPLIGGGASAVVDPESGYATAHIVYISLLGKYGLVGATLGLLFVLGPYVMARRLHSSDGQRRFVVSIIAPLLAMYFTYDFFMFLDFQYLLFGLAYASVLHGIDLSSARDEDPPCATRRGFALADARA